MPFLIYRDKMSPVGPNHYPYILEMALNQYRIDTENYFLHYITKPIFKNINCYNFNSVSDTRAVL